MKLGATITSERGKPVTKTGNEAISILLNNNMENKYHIIFDGDHIEILNYSDGSVETIETNGNLKHGN